MDASGAALVTGASRGIGRAVAWELARRGFDVIATMRDPADGAGLAEAARRDGIALRVEHLDVEAPETIRIPDGLRVVVNNAGVEGPYLPVEHTPLAGFRAQFETNVFGLIEVTRRAVPALRASGGGVVCNVTSASLLVPMPFFAAYRASKAAVSALGESLRTELAPFGIRVLEILPGAIDTDMLAGSKRPLEALAHPEYASQAERVQASRALIEGQHTAPERAAISITDAILDDSAPLRHACDPMSEALLQAWRSQTDEAAMAGMLSLFGGKSAAAPDAD